MFDVGLDVENSYYIIVCGVVKREGFETWTWFLDLLNVRQKIITYYSMHVKILADKRIKEINRD